MRQILDFLVGKKTYVMIVIDALDQLGVTLGWWDEAKIRTIIEFVLTAGFLRAGINSSAPTPVSFISKGLLKTILLPLLLVGGLVSLVACGKTVDQIVKTGQDLIGIAGETYKDVKENVETAKKLVAPADPSKAKP
jgi:hypothetical protein